MILDFLLYIAYSIANLFVYALPSVDSGVFADFETKIATIGGYITPLTNIIPITTFFSILLLFFTIELVLLTIKIFNWVIRKIPTIS